MVSIVILTKDEELDLPSCLESIQWADDLHILDSGSTDSTLDVAYSFGASVSLNPFVSFGQQRNYALDKLAIRHDWILFLDADEIITSDCKLAILNAITNASDETAGFYLCWRMMLEGRWLKRCDNFPKWQFRLMRKGRARFTDFGHGQKEDQVDGLIEYIKEPYVHNGFSKGWSHWIERHNRYSSQEAVSRLLNPPPLRNILSTNSSVRNPALKTWLSRVPGWPLIRFAQAYVLSLGLLEGLPGFIYCTNMAYYEFLIQIKMREFKRKGLRNRKQMEPAPEKLR